ncbi:MAG TPA: superoxide dismutase family protein [Gammaproteobacteria bacterium]
MPTLGFARALPALLAAAAAMGCRPQDTGTSGAPPAGQGQEPAARIDDSAAAPPPASAPEPSPRTATAARARAVLEPTEGHTASGLVQFTERGDGTLEIAATLVGLEPGTHGLHIHEHGDCSAPDGSSAGEHFAPDGDPHGAPRDAPDAHHAGDLGNVTASDGGMAEKRMTDDELSLTGTYGVLGRAVVVHQAEDDLVSQPSGNSGDPVACGVIEDATA